jgi:hypothetical protein
MLETACRLTVSTRRAANATAAAVVSFAALYAGSTQIADVRAVSPFADDPFDAVVSFAVIGLALVVGATWLRSISHRGPLLDPAVARRIRRGATIALALVGVTLLSDVVAMTTVRVEPIDARFGLLVGCVAVTAAFALAAAALLVRANRDARFVARPADATEPDVVDDLLALARDGSAHLPRLRDPIDHAAGQLERFLETSAVSPRRHRLVFGFVLAVAAGLGYDAWHSIIEGPPPSLAPLVVFAVFMGGGVLIAWVALLDPLRLLRPNVAER